MNPEKTLGLNIVIFVCIFGTILHPNPLTLLIVLIREQHDTGNSEQNLAFFAITFTFPLTLMNPTGRRSFRSKRVHNSQKAFASYPKP